MVPRTWRGSRISGGAISSSSIVLPAITSRCARRMRIILWSRVKLETFVKDGPDVELQLGYSLGADLTRLLKSAWQSPR